MTTPTLPRFRAAADTLTPARIHVLGLLVVLAGILATWLGVASASRRAHDDARRDFDHLADRLAEDALHAVEHPFRALRSIRDLHAASRSVERHEFRAIVLAQDLDAEYPGVRTLGVIERVPLEALDRFLARQRADEAPGFSVRDFSGHDPLFVVTFALPTPSPLEPGLDLGGERTLLPVLERVTRNAAPAVSTLPMPGAPVVYLFPIPLSSAPSEDPTPEAFAFAIADLPGLLRGVGAFDRSFIVFDLHAGSAPAEPTRALFRRVETLSIAGSEWALLIESTPGFDAGLDRVTPALAGLGGGVGVLLGVSIWAFLAAQASSLRRLRHEKRRAESALAEAQNLRQAIDKHALVSIADARGRIIDANDAFCRVTGYSRAELLGKDHRLLNSGHHPREFWAEMWAAVSAGRPWHAIVCNRARDGRRFWVDTVIAPFVGDDGAIDRFVAIRTDVSELQRKNAELEQYVYSVSHDLKSPLVTIRGFAEILRRNLAQGETPANEDAAARILRASDRMRAVIDDLLELSRAGRVRAEPETIDLGAIVAVLRDDFMPRLRERNATLLCDDVPPFRAERAKIWQVLQNLIDNALHYACTAPEPVIRIGAVLHPSELRLFVADNGPGIPAEHHERIFGIFQQLARDQGEGTGIGLAIVRSIAELYGGRAWVESTPDQGSTFWIALARPAIGLESDPTSPERRAAA